MNKELFSRKNIPIIEINDTKFKVRGLKKFNIFEIKNIQCMYISNSSKLTIYYNGNIFEYFIGDIKDKYKPALDEFIDSVNNTPGNNHLIFSNPTPAILNFAPVIAVIPLLLFNKMSPIIPIILALGVFVAFIVYTTYFLKTLFLFDLTKGEVTLSNSFSKKHSTTTSDFKIEVVSNNPANFKLIVGKRTFKLKSNAIGPKHYVNRISKFISKNS
ncbi:hypothetical protein KQI30_06750 [Clostridium bornimense]|uniref:hypothetical protein n=1 Tax=Clostridium bornimense TaxID=1216932 RepID=UPI001C0F6884|nr:hypothetical protein [Clostridium bornimense]MBU5315965.1 hypothetical protein [Clostridium bornimense]